MNSVPNVRSASYWLCARQRSRIRGTVACPPQGGRPNTPGGVLPCRGGWDGLHSLHPDRHVRSREAFRQQPLDFGLALVRGGGDAFVRRVIPQVRSQRHHRTQMQPAFGERPKEGGEPPGLARRADWLPFVNGPG